jgi:predicted AAA+ superfamily ATPase
MVLTAAQHGPSGAGACRFHPKRYLFDTGVLRDYREQAFPWLKLLDRTNPAARVVLGGVVENQTAVELARENADLSGWKKSSVGTEIDFVVKTAEGAVPVECKASLKIKGGYLKGVLDYMQGFNIKKGFLVSLAPFRVIPCPDAASVTNVPLYSAEYLLSRITGG